MQHEKESLNIIIVVSKYKAFILFFKFYIQ